MKSSPIFRNVSPIMLNNVVVNGNIIPINLSITQEFIFNSESKIFNELAPLIVEAIEKKCMIINLPKGQLEKLETLATKKGINKHTLCSNAIIAAIVDIENE